jgi:hypothetical protein
MKRYVSLPVILLLGSLIFAQESPQASSGDVSSDYRLDADGKINQRISWTRANAYFFEIEIERLTAGAVWRPEKRERTEQTFLELSLPPGMYRYRILNYNVLGRVGAVSEWIGIRVFVAKPPGAEQLNPPAYFIDSLEENFTLTVSGHDLVEEAELYIVARKRGAKPVLPASIQYSPDESAITAVFSAKGLALGAYDIVIINPGGIRQSLRGFSVGFSRPVDINVSLGYAPIIPAAGYFFNIYDSALYPLGVFGRISIVPLKQLWGWFGLEFSPHYVNLKTRSDAYDLTGNMVNLYVDALFQRWMRNYTMAVNLRLGGGISSVSGMTFDHKDGSRSETEKAMLAAINAGASVQWMVWKNLFIEAGGEYVQLVSSQGAASGFFRITTALGTKF